MAGLESIEVVEIMPADIGAYAHALGSDGRVYSFMGDRWLRMSNKKNAWQLRVDLIPGRKLYRGKFIIKAWVK